ncbi:MAG: tRNA-dihydrouridine synthase [Chloroflexi bacterium]|nr:tRNA-dihydrouridine synthase [Chloroflexota bacterium]
MINFWKQLPKPFLVLAPMENVTDFVFREIVSGLPKPDVFFTEFTNAEALTSEGYVATIGKLKYSENQRPIVAQIWGRSPEALYKAARLVQEMEFDGIDINMGCPDKTVIKMGAGSAHINNRTLTKEVIEAVKAGANNLPLSIKTRIGFHQDITEEWTTFLFEQKINALIIHGRIAQQMSKGQANWQQVGHAVKIKNKISPETILIGNGDIKSFTEAHEMHKNHGVDGVMIGRGIFLNPWVFEKTLDIKLHQKEEYIELLLKHVRLYTEIWGDTKNFDVMKKFIKMYIKDFGGANQLRQNLMETKNSDQVEEILLRSSQTLTLS